MGRERARGCGGPSQHNDPVPGVCFLAVTKVSVGSKSLFPTRFPVPQGKAEFS